MDKAVSWLKQRLDFEFSDLGLFQQALTHRSSPGQSNERLEFLGDAIMGAVIAEVVFRAQANSPEGDLSRLRASLVKDTSLAQLASDLGLGDFLILGSGERKTGGNRRESILADSLEALFGAVYVDAGFDACRTVIEKAFGERLHDLPDPADLRDPKTRLQEWLQARQMRLPNYRLVEVSGKAHRQSFEVQCSIDSSETTAIGRGTSRRDAEQQSAELMLENLKSDRN